MEKVGIPIIRLLVSSILSPLKHMLMAALTHLGLLIEPLDQEAATFYQVERSSASPSTRDNYVLMVEGSSPWLLVPVPIPLITSSIKKQLPIVEYADFKDPKDEEMEVGCAVCWDCIKRNHQIRELCNCGHVFHRECLDTWVDEGQLTCPLCRSMLLPPCTDPWTLLRTSAYWSSPTPTEDQQQQQLQQQQEQIRGTI